MKLNGTGLEKRSPRKITTFQPRTGSQKTNLQLTRVIKIKWRVNKKITFSNKKHRKTRLFLRITRPIIPLLIFPFTLQRIVREKFPLAAVPA